MVCPKQALEKRRLSGLPRSGQDYCRKLASGPFEDGFDGALDIWDPMVLRVKLCIHNALFLEQSRSC